MPSGSGESRRVLFNGHVPTRLRGLLSGHEVSRVQELGWHERTPDHILLASADQADFDVLVTGDNHFNMESHRRNPEVEAVWRRARNIGIVFLDPGRGGRLRAEQVLARAAEIDRAIRAVGPRGFRRVDVGAPGRRG